MFRAPKLAPFFFGVAALLLFAGLGFSQERDLVRKGDRLVLLGGTIAERLHHFGWLETTIQCRRPDLAITVRNLGWSGDEVGLMPRPLDFGDLHNHLRDQKPDVLLLCFGGNESFAGEKGLPSFERKYSEFLKHLSAREFNGETTARIVLVSPTAMENLGGAFPDPTSRNRNRRLYGEAIQKLSQQRGFPFIDLFAVTEKAYLETDGPLTINGLHFNEKGYQTIGEALSHGLGIGPSEKNEAREAVRELVVKKNAQFFLRWRPINGEYVYGRRKAPYGIVTFPPEMKKLDQMIGDLDSSIHEAAKEGVRP